MNKELEALERMLSNVDPREEYYDCDNDMEDYELIKSALERKEKLEQFAKIMKENVDIDFLIHYGGCLSKEAATICREILEEK